MHGLLTSLCVLCIIILVLIFLLRRLSQPYLVAYIIAGILAGPYAGRLFTSTDDVSAIGEIGLLLLMFFLGMEVNIPDNHSMLVKPVIAQIAKMLLAALFSLLIGWIFHWGVFACMLLFVLLVFNSTAVVIEFLKKTGRLHTAFGIVILNMLLLQDIMLAPLLTVFQFMEKESFSLWRLLAGIGASIVIFLLLRSARLRRQINPIRLRFIANDHELQVFLGGAICLGFGTLASLAGLSASIGSFVAGLLIGRLRSLSWLEQTLLPFRVFFVAFFFMSIGLQFDLSFVIKHYTLVLLGTICLLVSNSLLSAVVFRLLKYRWQESFYGGVLLSQAGEFGLLAYSVAFRAGIIDAVFFKMAIAVIALSLLFSSGWISLLQAFGNRRVASPSLQSGNPGKNKIHFSVQ